MPTKEDNGHFLHFFGWNIEGSNDKRWSSALLDDTSFSARKPTPFTVPCCSQTHVVAHRSMEWILYQNDNILFCCPQNSLTCTTEPPLLLPSGVAQSTQTEIFEMTTLNPWVDRSDNACISLSSWLRKQWVEKSKLRKGPNLCFFLEL